MDGRIVRRGIISSCHFRDRKAPLSRLVQATLYQLSNLGHLRTCYERKQMKQKIQSKATGSRLCFHKAKRGAANLQRSCILSFNCFITKVRMTCNKTVLF